MPFVYVFINVSLAIKNNLGGVMFKKFGLALFLFGNIIQASSAVPTLSEIGQDQGGGTDLVHSFFIFFACAVPQFAMSAYQAYHNNTVDSKGTSRIVQGLFPFVIQLNENGYTINPTTITSSEYFKTGLLISTLSFCFLLLGGVRTKYMPCPPQNTDCVEFGRQCLSVMSGSEQNSIKTL
jgi:hypothetical protein